jgi:hypothetical protein
MGAQIIAPPWHSPDAQANAHGLQANFAAAFWAIGEIDALGHRVLTRISAATIDSIDRLIGVAIMRRIVTQFVGIRHLLEASVVEQAKLGLRAQFESLLAVRYLIFGARRRVTFSSRSDSRRREGRARYFYVAAERRDIYARQVLLDNTWRFGSRPAARKKLKREIVTTMAELDNNFPPQQKRFGPLRCLAKKKKDRRYNDSRTWFSFGFPGKKPVNTIGALARRLGYGWEYAILYAALSGLTHPSGTKHDVKIEGKTLEVFHPYMAEAFEFLTLWSVGWQMQMCMWMAKSYDPSSIPDCQAVYTKTRAAIDALEPGLPDGFI